MEAFLKAAVAMAPQIIAAGKSLYDLFVLWGEVAAAGKDPTPEQWAALIAIMQDNSAIIQKPIPGEEA